MRKFLPKGRKILEIGSGGGMDAILLEEAGYEVTASDYAGNFVETLQIKGLNAIQFNAKTDDIPGTFDAIYANAVFVHFSHNELTMFLEKAKKHLVNEKVMFLSVIKGEGYERSSRSRGFGRDFYYYTKQTLEDNLKNQAMKQRFLTKRILNGFKR